MNKKNIVWIASYPKSGNTWFRVFLCNIIGRSKIPTSINELWAVPNASNRSLIDKYIGVPTSDLTDVEIKNCRPDIYRNWSRSTKETIYLKVHDAWELNSEGNPIFPYDITKGVIYIVRHPLDIAVSFSYHNSTDISTSINILNDSKYGLCQKPDLLYNQVSQKLLNWSEHISSWMDDSGLSIHIIRYEDMINKPLETFRSALQYLNIEHSESELVNAINFSSFKNLADQEKANGFKERPIKTKLFFREGKENTWVKRNLDKELVLGVYNKHHKIMNRLGYSTDIDIIS